MIEMDSELIRKITEKGERIDNRKFDQYREISIEKNCITSAEGSAKVKLGKTEVIAGVKIDTGEPFPDTPNEGILMVGAEFLPLASFEFESGPPGENAIELARVIDRTIRESKAVDFKKLCIKPATNDEKGKIWSVFVDIDIIDYDGNLIDAACLAATAALTDAKLPDLDKDEKPIYDKKGKKKLPLTGKPIATTFVKINGSIISDPLIAEELAMDARMTIGTVDKDGKIYLTAMQKGGSKGITVAETESIFDKAVKKGEELRKLIK